MASVRRFACSNLSRRTRHHHPAAGISPFGPQIDHPVGRLDNIQVVFDHQHRMPFFRQAMKHIQQPFDILKMQAGSGFIKDEEPKIAAVFL